MHSEWKIVFFQIKKNLNLKNEKLYYKYLSIAKRSVIFEHTK